MVREELQKVTVLLPKALVKRALEATGQGLTPTIRKGLEEITVARAYEELRKMRGKVSFSISADELRKDRV